MSTTLHLGEERDEGTSLVEIMVAVALIGVMSAIAIGGWSAWARASSHSGAAQAIQTVVRQAQQRAVTEGVSMCVEFGTGSAADTYTVYRGSCAAPERVRVDGPYDTGSPDVHVTSPTFSSTAGTSTGVTFSARGTAWPGQVQVTRRDSAKVYRITVEGLTGRVQLG
jgi:Tfp pilus assembly protein FimT